MFRYVYDAQGRLIMKKVPGADEVNLVCDKRDRLVMTQDAAAITPALLPGKFVDNEKHEFNASLKVSLNPMQLQNAITKIWLCRVLYNMILMTTIVRTGHWTFSTALLNLQKIWIYHGMIFPEVMHIEEAVLHKEYISNYRK